MAGRRARATAEAERRLFEGMAAGDTSPPDTELQLFRRSRVLVVG